MNAIQLAAKLSLLARFLRMGDSLGINLIPEVTNIMVNIAPAGMVKVTRHTGEVACFPKMSDFEIGIGLDRGKLDAIKEYKTRTGLSLIDAKRSVEQYFEQKGLQFYRQPY